MTEGVGKREAHKAATRRAIQEAADALFDQRGFATTTVREIADAAGVTERTFFRYFPGKDALLVDDITSWLPTLTATITRRPTTESALDAVENAFFELGQHLWATAKPNLSWLFLDGPPAGRLANTAPLLLLQFEQAIADALEHRTAGGSTDAYFGNQVIARASVAALRSAGIRHWQLRDAQMADRPSPVELLRSAFGALRQL